MTVYFKTPLQTLACEPDPVSQECCLPGNLDKQPAGVRDNRLDSSEQAPREAAAHQNSQHQPKRGWQLHIPSLPWQVPHCTLMSLEKGPLVLSRLEPGWELAAQLGDTWEHSPARVKTGGPGLACLRFSRGCQLYLVLAKADPSCASQTRVATSRLAYCHIHYCAMPLLQGFLLSAQKVQPVHSVAAELSL